MSKVNKSEQFISKFSSDFKHGSNYILKYQNFLEKLLLFLHYKADEISNIYRRTTTAFFSQTEK